MQADTVIRNVRLVDGADTPRLRDDDAIADRRIAAMERLSPGIHAATVIAAGDRYLAPGVVDPHTYSNTEKTRAVRKPYAKRTMGLGGLRCGNPQHGQAARHFRADFQPHGRWSQKTRAPGQSARHEMGRVPR